jgi:uncharacterized OB-fold protein
MNNLTPIQEFEEGLKNKKLVGTKCSCGSISVYPNFHCSKCSNASFEKIKLSGKGTLITYTILHAVPLRFKENAPLVIGLVEFEEGGRISTQLDASQDELSVGKKLEAVFQERDGGIVLKFKPLGGI